MVVLVVPPVSSRVSGFPLASPCLLGKLQNLSFCPVANCENCWKSRTKCSFWCSHASRLDSSFPVSSPCLWGKLENLSFSNVSKQVVMSFCVAGVALCDIPTCLITCGKYQNWRKSRRKCSFFCTHVSRLESLVFLWRRRVYGGSSALHTLHFTLIDIRVSIRVRGLNLVTFAPFPVASVVVY